MDRAIAVSRTCNLSFAAVACQFSTDPAAVLRLATDEAVRAEVGELSRTWADVIVPLSWYVDRHKHLLPAVTGHLRMTGTSPEDTEISFLGDYPPPSGLLPSVGERLLGHRVIDAEIGRLLDQLVAYLEQQRPTAVVVR